MANNIDVWTGLTNWLAFVPVAAGIGYYYWSTQARGRPGQSSAPNRRPNEREIRGSTLRRDASAERSVDQSGSDGAKKRKLAASKPKPEPQPPIQVHIQGDEPEKEDMSPRQFAEQMMRAKQGTNLTASKSKEQRVKTVKQGNAVKTPVLLSGSSHADADDDMPPTQSLAFKAGDVTDMLEPAPAGPTTLRLMASSKPIKEKAPKPKKEGVVETKKQRQNRQKKEAERQERARQEQERKAMEERQRRAAREARGEPAKNGIAVSKPPTTQAWAAGKPVPPANEDGMPPIGIGSTNGPMLDTYDAESTASSDGMKASTAATSTTEAESNHRELDMSSGEEVASKAQSGDDGWTTVAVPRKQKKTGNTVPSESKPSQTAKLSINGRPNGFLALNEESEQRAGLDPMDASNWDA